MAHQCLHLEEIATMIRDQLLTADAVKRFCNHARKATYPDPEAFRRAQREIEKKWPAYADDTKLMRPPPYVWKAKSANPPQHILNTDSIATWLSEGAEWRQRYDSRLQHVLAHMNHHIHPACDEDTGERRPLQSCQRKDRPKECKAGFPLDNEITRVPLLVCPCIAEARGLPQKGPKGPIGTILPARNDPWLNAAPTAWLEFTGSNGDIKFALRLPILPETHEETDEILLYDIKNCYGRSETLDLAYEVQVGQSVTAGYFGGYSAKMPDVGQRELRRMGEKLRTLQQPQQKHVQRNGIRAVLKTVGARLGKQRHHENSGRDNEPSCAYQH